MLGKTLRRRIKHGRLTIIRPDGHTEQFGELTAAKPHPDVAVRLKGALTSLKLSLHPDLYFGELYADGALIIERGTIWDLLELLGRNQLEQGACRATLSLGLCRHFCVGCVGAILVARPGAM
jgi:cyclopropane-fatty-acyl-phospholipid synthase